MQPSTPRIPASVNYHVKKPVPQAFEFEADGIAGNLRTPELSPTPIQARDVRANADAFDFKTDGLTFVTAPTSVQTFDQADPTAPWIEPYNTELTTLLQTTLQAVEVIVFDHTLRVDKPDATRRPARNVHNDYSQNGAEQRLQDLLGPARAQEFDRGHYGFVNVWRPVANIIQSSPLGFIDPKTMATEDWMTIDLIYPDRRGEILGVAHNPAHDWFFCADMTPDEVVIFNIYDNQGRHHLAHSALDLPGDATARYPRRSLESRTLVRYA